MLKGPAVGEFITFREAWNPSIYLKVYNITQFRGGLHQSTLICFGAADHHVYRQSHLPDPRRATPIGERQPGLQFLPKTIKVSEVWIMESLWHGCVWTGEK